MKRKEVKAVTVRAEKKVKAGQSNERKNQNSDKNEKEGEGVEIKKENP